MRFAGPFRSWYRYIIYFEDFESRQRRLIRKVMTIPFFVSCRIDVWMNIEAGRLQSCDDASFAGQCVWTKTTASSFCQQPQFVHSDDIFLLHLLQWQQGCFGSHHRVTKHDEILKHGHVTTGQPKQTETATTKTSKSKQKQHAHQNKRGYDQ